MNMPINTIQRRAHPMLIIAGTALVLFCAVGTAAILGWIPTSTGSNAGNSPVTQADQSAKPVKKVQQTIPRQASAVPSKPECLNCGVVQSTREITVPGQGSGLGAAGGAVVGGLLGNQVGGGRGQDLMTVVGAVGGAVVGNQIEGKVKSSQSYEVVVRLDDGSIRTVQQANQPAWQSGARVKIVDGVVRSNG